MSLKSPGRSASRGRAGATPRRPRPPWSPGWSPRACRTSGPTSTRTTPPPQSPGRQVSPDRGPDRRRSRLVTAGRLAGRTTTRHERGGGRAAGPRGRAGARTFGCQPPSPGPFGCEPPLRGSAAEKSTQGGSAAERSRTFTPPTTGTPTPRPVVASVSLSVGGEAAVDEEHLAGHVADASLTRKRTGPTISSGGPTRRSSWRWPCAPGPRGLLAGPCRCRRVPGARALTRMPQRGELGGHVAGERHAGRPWPPRTWRHAPKQEGARREITLTTAACSTGLQVGQGLLDQEDRVPGG